MAAGVSSSSPSAAGITHSSTTKIYKQFAYVNDVVPTILDYAGVHENNTITSASTYVHAIMGRSLKPLFNGTADKVYGANDTVPAELFNMSSVYTGDGWKAQRHVPPWGDGKWQLYNITSDPGENHNIADQHPALLAKLIHAYNTYALEVGVVPPLGQQFYKGQQGIPAVNNQTKMTITSADIFPAQFKNSSSVPAMTQPGPNRMVIP